MLRRPAKLPDRTRFGSARLCALALAVSFCACAYGQGSSDVDHTPIANHGAGASIIYPGQGAPTYQTGGQYGPRGGVIGSGQPAESIGSAPPQAANRGSGGGTTSQSGTPGSGGGGGTVSFLGGSEQDEVSHESYKNEPYIVKYLALPFAMVAAPFKAAYDAARGAPEPGPEIPRTTQQASRLPAPTSPHPSNSDLSRTPSPVNSAPLQSTPPTHSEPRDYESVQLQKLERELEQRGAMRSSSSPTFSIADELAALQRTVPAPSGPGVRGVESNASAQYASLPAPAPLSRRDPSMAVAQPSSGSALSMAEPSRADGIVDRNGDGRIDNWLYRENGRLVREVLDDDFDGQGERSIHYDVVSGQVVRIEDDFNHDSAIDCWTDYRDGHVIRRRSDLDGDGAVDSWTYYRDGEISRHERDTTGDGFRGRVGYYQHGLLDFEEQDLDGDGRAEVTVRYDAKEQIVSREEDLNGDGGVDLISHFENGKLKSREILDPKAIEAAPRG